ncbi:hypothetical protein MWN34_12430 [Ancylobacter sp. 6x-1]|uniref:Uncharacterized protein n=1 Tax=Ancylobacter crimeensis TaxID=2579147 RepID=A0ABT0DCX1_9HYPH|nr:hypothetical protein [Ancylobacter crimeensis]MCK0197719.1 hypothetical protein [Ancylobacter crimeensis]
MTSDEFQAALAKLGTSPAAIAKVLGVDIRTARRWATGGKAIPDTVASQIATLAEAGHMPVEPPTRQPVQDTDVVRFVWARLRGDEPAWTVAEHDQINDIYYLPGRLDRYSADDLEFGPVIELPGS